MNSTNIRSMRESLGITRVEFCRRYNLPLKTVTKWEVGEATPPSYIPILLERLVSGDFGDPDKVEVSTDRTISEVRAASGLSQPKFEAKYQIGMLTVSGWETGKRKPPAYVVALLDLAVRADFGGDE